MQRGFVALVMPVRTFSITKNTTSYQFGTRQHFFFIFVLTETEKVTQTGTGSEDLPVTVAQQNETTLSSSKQGISFFKLVIRFRSKSLSLYLKHGKRHCHHQSSDTI